MTFLKSSFVCVCIHHLIIIIIIITLFNEGKDIDYWSPSSFHNGPHLCYLKSCLIDVFFFFKGVVSSMKESFGFIERADKVSEVRFLKVTIQFSINTVELRCTDTSLLRRVFLVPGEKALTFFLN